MGIPTPTYYDQLLLTKCKLLLQAALANPKRKGGSYSWEEFVTGLDERDEGTIRTFEVLLQETALRRPRKSNLNNATASSSTDASRRRPRPVMSLLPPGPLAMLNGHWTSDSDDSLRSEDDDEEDEVDEAGPTSLRQYFTPPLYGLQTRADTEPTLRPQGIPAGRAITTTSTMTAASDSRGNGQATAVPIRPSDPSQRLRAHERSSLFGTGDSSPSFSELLDSIYASHPLGRDPLGSTSSFDDSILNSERPTPEEVWRVVTDGQEPVPAAALESFDSYLECLNTAPAHQNLITRARPIVARNMDEVVAQLTSRDVTFGMQLQSAVLRRLASGMRRGSGASQDLPYMEGIWRTEVEPAESTQETTGSSAGDRSSGRNTFSDFARRRRARTRERQEEGVVPPVSSTSTQIMATSPQGSLSVSAGMTVGSSASSSLDNETPHSATTPTTSHAPSPASTCPPPTVPSRSPTSAERAIAAMQRQREFAPLRASIPASVPAITSSPSTTSNLGQVRFGNAARDALNRTQSFQDLSERLLQGSEAVGMGGTEETADETMAADIQRSIGRILRDGDFVSLHRRSETGQERLSEHPRRGQEESRGSDAPP